MTDADRRLAYVALFALWSAFMLWGAYKWLHFGEYTAEQRVQVEKLRACKMLIPDAARECLEER